jgi:DNA polymerase/3'-5' exonuclease PolX
MVRRGDDLAALPGIGEAISAKVNEIVNTGQLRGLKKAIAPNHLLDGANRRYAMPRKMATLVLVAVYK